MRTVKEIDEQMQIEHDYMAQLYAQIHAYEISREHLKAERETAEKAETEEFIDEWLNNHFGILNQKEAKTKAIFIVFDKNATFVKTITTGYGEEFHYVSPVEDEDTLEHWLRENGLYAHRASSFCDRNRSWYDLPLSKQLESLLWDIDANGQLVKTQW